MARYLLCAHENDTYKFVCRKPLLDMMAGKGFEIHVAIPAGQLEKQVVEWGYTPHLLPLSRGSLNPLKELGTYRSFKELHRSLQPTLTHNFTSKAVLYGSLAGSGAIVSTITGIGFSLTGGMSGLKGKVFETLSTALHRRACAKNARVIFQNADDMQVFLDHGILQRQRAVLIQGSGVDMSFNHPSKRIVHSGKVRFVMLSRLIGPKGVRELVEAARIVEQRQPGLCAFILVGAIDEENPKRISREELDAWQAEGIVDWLGVVPNAVEAFKDADVAVLPSYWLEGLPRSMVEAAAMGLPLITTSNSGCKDALIDGETGIIVPPREVEPLADAILKLALSRDLREQYGTAGRKFVEARYSIESVLEQTERVYEIALGNSA